MRPSAPLGDKLGPRLVQLLVDAVVRSRAALAPHEARVAQAATQALIDRMGHEIADLHAPLFRHLLHDEDVPQQVRDYVRQGISGHHQWQALAFAIGGAGTQALGLGAVLSNYLAPVTRDLMAADPRLGPGTDAIIGMMARGIIGGGQADYWLAGAGIAPEWRGHLEQLAQAWGDPSSLGQLINRGHISEGQAERWLRLAGISPEVTGPALSLRHTLLSPADAALAVLRGSLGHGEGERIAAESGVNAGTFATLLDNTGEPLGLEQLAEALRRGFIDRGRFAKGLRQSRVRNEWLDVAEALRYGPVTTADAVDAALRGHLEWDAAESIAAANGIEPGQFRVLRANAGSPPAPEQLLDLWRRGVISEGKVDDGLRFGRLRDDWIPAVKHLRYARISTADAADAWLRGHLNRDQAVGIMEENGLDPRDVGVALGNAGNPLGLGQLLEALRRGFIDEATFERGFTESRYRPEWHQVALKLRRSPMSTADAVEAAVQGHIPIERARAVAEENGLEPQDFQALYETAGSPLSRTEMETLLNRGLVTTAEVEQALRESRVKDKYVHHAVQLHVRLPEGRQVVTALEEGVIPRAEAIRQLGDLGYDAATVRMLIATAEARSTGPHRQLMTGEISRLYADRIIEEGEARQLLEQLHYTPESASLILRLADYTTQRRILDSGVTAVRSHFLAGRITETTAAGDLHALGLPASAVTAYMRAWRVDKLAHPRQLSEAQIVKAHKLGLFTPPHPPTPAEGARVNDQVARERLVALGYDTADAQLLLDGA